MDRNIDLVTLAIELPGASALLREAGINFHSSGRPTLALAAQSRGVALEPLVARLRRHARALSQPHAFPDEHAAAINTLLVEAARLARGLEARFVHRPGCPYGLATEMKILADTFGRHDLEEQSLGQGALAPEVRQKLLEDHRVLAAQIDQVSVRLSAAPTVTSLGCAGQALLSIWRALSQDLRARLAFEDRQLERELEREAAKT